MTDMSLLKEAAQSISPLPSGMRHGLIAITVLAFVSFAASTTLFAYLTYKLVAWRFLDPSTRPAPTPRPGASTPRPAGRQSTSDATPETTPEATTAPASNGKSFSRAVDFALGIDGLFSDNDEQKLAGEDGQADNPLPRRRNPPNQFLLLIYNLLLADMHQATAFLLNVAWLAEDAIIVGSPTCWAQGWFVSTGDLASSCFITAIAIHTYLSVVRRVRISHGLIYLVIFGIWFFVYAISGIPIAATMDGAGVGGFFVRAGSWCWMNHDYDVLRLVTHYLFIFIALVATVSLYTAIFFSLRREDRAARGVIRRVDGGGGDESLQLQLSHNPAFLIYPVIYVLCTLPLALGRLTSMAGAEAPIPYLSFAGAMISSNGLFDCLLFGTTRNVIVFASKYDVGRLDTGLRTFAFMQTPARSYGNMIWVQGGRRKPEKDKTTGGWWSWQRLAGGAETFDSGRKGVTRSVSEESLRGPAEIQMEMITSVVVEMEPSKERDMRYPDPGSASQSPSLNSTEKDYRMR